MTVVDLHPEDLLDKDARDELTDDERVRLDAHLARCAACRAERLLRADFADELEGEDRPSAIISLVKGALAAPTPTREEPATREEAPELDAIPGLTKLRRPRRTVAFLLVAAAILAASAAGATGLTARVWTQIRGNAQEATHSSATSSPTSAPLAKGRVVGSPAGTVAVPPPAEDVAADSAIETNTAVDPAPTPVAVPPSAPAAPPAPTHVAAAPTEPGPTIAAPIVAPAASPAPAAPPPAVAVAPPPAVAVAPPPVVAVAPASAAALFEAANTARRTGDTNGALSRYEALATQFPGSREARVAKATAGRLLLDRGDAAGALAHFDAYLASGSVELREEAMAGRATALERLGRNEDESRAWAALLATYPNTPYAAHAKARVGRSLPQ